MFQAAVTTLRKFFRNKPDVVWLLLQSTYCTEELSAPHPVLQAIELPKSAFDRNEYTDSIRKVFL